LSLTTAFFLLTLTIVVVIGFVLKNKSKKSKKEDTRTPEKTIELIKSALAEEKAVPQDATVEPKTVAVASEHEESASSYLEANGLTFSDFQKAFGLGREKPVMDHPERNYAGVLDDLQALRPALERSGETFQDYIESHHMKVPDALLELWATGPSSTATHSLADDLAPEAMMLAREALQPLSASADQDAAAVVLRDILAARTEADRLGMHLPAMPYEQASAIRAWASKTGTAATIAQTILSRY
jgi:hypothetical protein